VGEALFGGLNGSFGIVHIIGERPGTGHHTFSAYLTAAPGTAWATAGKIDHDITKVVSGIANTALLPVAAADETARLTTRLFISRLK
jgi:ethanolamine ammonia-lyase large subunit